VQVLVCAVVIEVGRQEALTDVMVGLLFPPPPLLPLPPQAVTNPDKMQITINANTIRVRAMNHLPFAVFGK
jgi:hypothetical protein